MPLVKSKSKSKKALNNAIKKNISILTNENKNRSKPRSHEQIVAIAINYAKNGKKRKK